MNRRTEGQNGRGTQKQMERKTKGQRDNGIEEDSETEKHKATGRKRKKRE